MKKAACLNLLVLMVLLYSCEYQSSEVYNRPVNRNIAPPHIQVVDLNIGEDTIFVYWSMEIRFKFQSDNQAIKGVRFLIDGADHGTVNSETGTFIIPGYNVGEGLHDLTIEVYTASGTGSFADEFGVEGFVSSQSWKLVILNTYDAAMIKTVENGLLHIKWNPYLASDFKEYIIGKWGENSYETEIARVNTNEFIDSTYVGEQSRYYISVMSTDNITCYKGDLYLNSELPVVLFTAGDSNRYAVKWSRPKYYNAVDSFVVFQTNQSDYYTTRVKSTHDINDLSCRITGGIFGDVANFKVRLVPKKVNVEYFPAAYDYFESQTYGSIGYPFKLQDFNPICQKVNHDEFVFFSGDTLKRYSTTTLRTVDKFVYHDPGGCNNFEDIHFSNSGKYLISYVGCNRDIFFASVSDLQQYSVHKLHDVTGGQLRTMAVSNSGTLIVSNISGGFNLYDMVSSQPTGFYGKSYNGDFTQQTKISPSGEYFFAPSDSLHLVQFKNGHFTEMWKANPFENRYYGFDSQNPNQFILWNGSRLSVRLCSDFSVVNQFELVDDDLLDIDYATREILTYSTGHFYVRSLSDGSLIRDVPTTINPWIPMGYSFLVNNTIVCAQGLLYFIR